MTAASLRRVCAAVTAGLLGVSLLAGCSGSKARGSTRLEKTNITIGAIQSASAAGLYVAQARGFFTGEGLHVKIVPTIGSGQSIPFVVNGAWDLSFGNYVSYFLAQTQGTAKLHMLAEGYVAGEHEFEVVALKSSSISSVQDLRGKKIGVNALNNIATLMISSTLKTYGVPVSAVQFVPFPFPQMGVAIQKHEVDAAWFTEPFLTEAEKKVGTKVVFDSYQGGTTNFPISGYVSTNAWLSKYPKTAAAFKRALEKGQALASTNHALVQQVLPKFMTIDPATAQVIAIGSYPTTTDPLRLQRVSDLMSAFGMLKQPFDVKTMIGG